MSEDSVWTSLIQHKASWHMNARRATSSGGPSRTDRTSARRASARSSIASGWWSLFSSFLSCRTRNEAVAILCAVLLAQNAFADEIQCAIDFPNRCSVGIKAGEKARFEGMLLSADMAIYLGQTADSWEERMSAAVTKTASIAKANAKRDALVAAANMHAIEAERDLYKKSNERSLIEHPVIVAGITALVMVGVLLVAKKIDKATQ